jgi:hypothetical protein
VSVLTASCELCYAELNCAKQHYTAADMADTYVMTLFTVCISYLVFAVQNKAILYRIL